MVLFCQEDNSSIECIKYLFDKGGKLKFECLSLLFENAFRFSSIDLFIDSGANLFEVDEVSLSFFNIRNIISCLM